MQALRQLGAALIAHNDRPELANSLHPKALLASQLLIEEACRDASNNLRGGVPLRDETQSTAVRSFLE